MSEHPPADLDELTSCLGVPVPGLILLRYRSALVLDALLAAQRAHLGDRLLHEVRYDPRSTGAESSPSSLAEHCRSLAATGIPIIVLRPEPGAAADQPEVAFFWKQMNAQREALGALPAQILLCLDEAHTAAAFHHAKDLVSWCSPKFEFLALTPGAPDRFISSQAEKTSRDARSATWLIWEALYPLWRQTVASGNPPGADTTSRLLIPLLQTALDLGMVTQATALLREASSPQFRDESQQAHWLSLCGDLAVAQGDLAGALRSFTESKAIAARLAASDPANAAWQRDLSVFLDRLGELAVAQGDLAGALRSFSEAKAIRERLAASDPANAAWQRDLSVSLNKLGDLAMAQGDLAGALRSFTESKAIAARLAARDPASAAWQRDLSVSLIKLGDLAVAQGDLAGALRSFTDAQAIAERLAASDPANAAWQRDLAVSHFKLYQFAEKKGDEAMMQSALHACFTVLDAMKRRALHMDPTIAQLHTQLLPQFTQPGPKKGPWVDS